MTRARETSENARLAKAWVNFDGSFASSPFTIANGGIRDAFNVSSVTDNNTGDFTVNFSINMNNANYSVAGLTGNNNTTGAAGFPACIRTKLFAANSIRIEVSYSSATDNNVYDYPLVSIIVFGE